MHDKRSEQAGRFPHVPGPGLLRSACIQQIDQDESTPLPGDAFWSAAYTARWSEHLLDDVHNPASAESPPRVARRGEPQDRLLCADAAAFRVLATPEIFDILPVAERFFRV